MESIKKFEGKKVSALNQIFGGKGKKVEKTCGTEKSGNLEIEKHDGFYDENDDGIQNCGEVGYVNQTYVDTRC